MGIILIFNKKVIYLINFEKTISMLNKILLTLFICSSLLAQKKQIDEISYEQANDIQFFVNIKNGTRTKSYIFEDSNKISVGDTLTLGVPSSG